VKVDPRPAAPALTPLSAPAPKPKDSLARLASRVTIAQSATIREAASQIPIEVVVKDISIGGARISTHLRLRPNQRVTLTLQISAAILLELPARVIHSGDVGKEYRCIYGLRFDYLSEDVARSLSEFVYERLSLRGASLQRVGKVK